MWAKLKQPRRPTRKPTASNTPAKRLPGQTTPTSHQPLKEEPVDAPPTPKKKRKRDDLDEDSMRAPQNLSSEQDKLVDSTATIKTPKKGKTTGKPAPKKGSTKQKAKSMGEDDEGRGFRATDDSIGTRLQTVILTRDELGRIKSQRDWWKISGDVMLSRSKLVLLQGQVTSYNVSQMNPTWIKSFVKNLRDVAQMVYSVRGWKQTLLFALGAASEPDNSDDPIVNEIKDLEKRQRNGGVDDAESEARLDELEAELDAWEPGWKSEPLYSMDAIQGAFDDPTILILRLSTTHGEFFIRTDEAHEPWKDFMKWLFVTNKNMIGYRSRRGGNDWNGFEITEKQLAEDEDLKAKVVEIEALFHEHSCLAIWRTVKWFNYGKPL